MSLMSGSHYAIFVVKTSVVRLNDENLATAHIIRLHATASLTLRDNSFPSVIIRVTAILVDQWKLNNATAALV